MSRILIVEDEESIAEMLQLNLKVEGYDTVISGNGREALEVYRSKKFDLILLDIMLPELDGISVCETIRLEDQETPILMLTAKNTGKDRVHGLRVGADDYLAKPFNLEELLLRVEKLIQRSSKQEEVQTNQRFSFGNCQVDFATFEVIGSNKEKITLSKRQMMLLKLLIDREGQVVSREDILEKVWGFDVYPTTRTIDNYMVEFRKIFEKDPKNLRHFHSIRGVGYKFTA